MWKNELGSAAAAKRCHVNRPHGPPVVLAPPPPQRGASGPQLVAKGAGPRGPQAPKETTLAQPPVYMVLYSELWPVRDIAFMMPPPSDGRHPMHCGTASPLVCLAQNLFFFTPPPQK